MGKALVINSMSVSNPLCSVVFGDEYLNNILNAYYAVNTTINDEEKLALRAFVQGLISANLWSKMIMLYPMLGSDVASQSIDLVNPSASSLISLDTDGLSVDSNRVMQVGSSRSASFIDGTSLIGNLDKTNLSLIASATHTTLGTAEQYLMMYHYNNKGITSSMSYGIETYSGGYKQPRISVGSSTIIPTNSECGAQTKYLERIICGTIAGTSASIYKDGQLLGAGTTALTTTYNYVRVFGSDVGYSANMLAIGNAMSADEWSTYYTLLLTFLQAVGKHS